MRQTQYTIRGLIQAATIVSALLGLLAPSAGRASRDVASGWVTAANSEVRLNWCGEAFTGAVDPKAALLAFLEIEMDPGWKTYWRMPGDAGVAPSFDWTAATNVAQALPYFPAPHRLPDQGGEVIGYKGSVIFPVKIDRRNADAPTPLAATISYGICKNICIPVEVTVKGGCFDGGISAAIARSVEAVPRAPGERRDSDPALAGVSGSVVANPARLTVDVDFGAGASDTDLFIEAPDGLYVPLPQKAKPDAKGRASFTVDLSKVADAKDLLGKELRLTMVSSKGASEALWVAK